MIKKTIFILLFWLCYIITYSQIDSVKFEYKKDSISNIKFKKEKTVSQVSLHKYYIYAEAWNFLSGGYALHFEVNIFNRKSYADYLNFSLGFQYDTDWISNYPNLQGEYNFSHSFAYIFTKIKSKICYEFGISYYAFYGDPIARSGAQGGYGQNKLSIFNTLIIALRYNFKKIPLQIRLSSNTLYSYSTKQFLPILPSVSIGYGFKKIKNMQNIKMQTYSKTNE